MKEIPDQQAVVLGLVDAIDRFLLSAKRTADEGNQGKPGSK